MASPVESHSVFPSVSVALCTYNSARFIEEQLSSILDQEVLPAEIVISDDGSSDDTLIRVRAILGAHADSVIRFRILTGESRLGISRNFQRAVEACTADVIALSDHDDVWHRDRLSTGLRSFAGHPDLLLQHSDARLIDQLGTALGPSLFEALGVTSSERLAVNDGRAFGAYLRRNLVTGATVLFQRSLLQHALPFPVEWVHDEWLAIIASALGKVELLDARLIDYRQHGQNQIGVQKPTLRYRVRRMLEPRGRRYQELSLRSAILSHRLEELPVASEYLELARRKAGFETVRGALPANRFARVRTILREYRAGSYALLSSQGDFDVVRDLLQPA